MPLTTDAKSRLSQTIRGLRERLIRDIGDHLDAIYQLGITDPARARLSEAARAKRARLEAWTDERVRASGADTITAQRAAAKRFRDEAVGEAAATFLNRLVYLRLLEHMPGPDGRPLRRLRVLTGGWNSPAYREFREFAGPLLEDESEGYEALLSLVFEDLAIDLPGLYGQVGITPLIPIPVSTLRHTIAELDQPGLNSAWDDDTTFGWVYQYWNDPVREALDAKINDGGKIEPHEIASKTQMFTERYMVEWLLQNSLGPSWIALCRQHGWAPDLDAVLPDLEVRRNDWRVRRAAGEVTLEALMPIRPGLEERWKYYVPQDIPDEAVKAAPDTLKELKVLDPACGSGHFLVIALDWLFHAYKEEARHRGAAWSDTQIVEWIVENNLHGIDIDPRAVQIAAAALLLKARSLAPDCQPRRMNLVAPAFNLAGLPEDDPALRTLLQGVEAEAGLPQSLTRGVIRALEGADHLGTLLKVEDAIGDALLAHQTAGQVAQPTFEDYARGLTREIDYASAEATLLEGIERFLANHTAGADLGLRLDGEQLAAGIRFIRMVRPGSYHVVVANPPYLGLKKSPDAEYLESTYPSAKYDLFAAFIIRSVELLETAGLSALVNLRGWIFQDQYKKLRRWIARLNIVAVADLHWGAFAEMKDVSASMEVIRAISGRNRFSSFLRPVPAEHVKRDQRQFVRNIAGLICLEKHELRRPRQFSAVKGMPFVYWWSSDFIKAYRKSRKISSAAPVRQGAATSNNPRFLRHAWELDSSTIFKDEGLNLPDYAWVKWVPYIKGAAGRKWFEPLDDVVIWGSCGVEVRSFNEYLYGSYSRTVKNERYYFRKGVAFTSIGSEFSARVHRFVGVFGHTGSSVYADNWAEAGCLLNSSSARYVLESLNPGTHFEVGDVNRLPLFPIESADEIYATLDRAFTEHEAVRENSVEFRRPGPSAWTDAQAWAQTAVDRPAGEPLPPYRPAHEDPAPVAWVSYALGQALGRFGRAGEGILNHAPDDALPHGMLFLSGATAGPAEGDVMDGLRHPACAALRAAWDTHGPIIKRNRTLRRWLREDFFKLHRATYESRPIWLPLSSRGRTFVAWVSIHRWTDRTLDELRAGPVLEERQRLEGRLADVKTVLAAADNANRGRAEKEQADLSEWLEELRAFDETLRQIAEQGASPVDSCPPRAADARFTMELDDGVMVNSAGLWPLLDAQWRDPRKWWAEMAKAQGRKNYDWSRLAARYWPARVAEACQRDPSLAVAHGCFWRLHPQRAYAWELRLQEEIRPGFTIDEMDSDEARQLFLAEQPEIAEEILQKELRRRDRKYAGQDQVGDIPDEDGEEGVVGEGELELE